MFSRMMPLSQSMKFDIISEISGWIISSVFLVPSTFSIMIDKLQRIIGKAKFLKFLVSEMTLFHFPLGLFARKMIPS